MPKCSTQGCVYNAELDKPHCIQHRPPKLIVPQPAPEFAFVPMSQVPATSRYNETAGNLFKALIDAPTGEAIKLNMKIFKKIALVTAQRYALAKGMRIGVRIVGDSGYLWRLSPDEVKAVEVKAQRLIAARSKKRSGQSRAAIAK